MANERRLLCINEFGVPIGAMGRVRSTLHEEWRATETGGQRLEVFTFGGCDLQTIHDVPDLRSLATTTSKARVSHQRTFGAAVVDVGSTVPAYLGLEAAFDPFYHLPFVATTQLKIDPLIKILFGGRAEPAVHWDIVTDVFHALPSFLLGKYKLLEAGADDQDCVNDLHDVRILPLGGLDSADILLVLRCKNLNAMVRVISAIRSLRLADLYGSEQLADALKCGLARLDLTVPDGRRPEMPEMLPIWTYSSTVVGLPCELLTPESKIPRGAELACREAILALRMRSLPGARVTNEHLQRLDSIFGRGQGTQPSAPWTVIGPYDLLYPARASSQPGGPTGAYTLQQIADVLRVEVEPESRGMRFGYFQETTVAVQALPQHVEWPDEQREERRQQEPGLQDRFESRLDEAQKAWLLGASSAYHRLTVACKEQHWPYSSTNGALSLLVSLVTLLTDRLEMENYLELLPPLDAWIREVVDKPDAGPELRVDDIYRTYKHLDRMMHARSHRDSPYRPPGVSRAFEARAGYVLPRDAFHAYLSDMAALRIDQQVLLVDGTDGDLMVKHARGVAVFFVSALRLHNPILWPCLAHEIEHARYRAREPDGTSLHDRLWQWMFNDQIRWPGADKDDRRPWRHARTLALDTACDVALADSGALSRGPDLGLRFIATCLPNFVMELLDKVAQPVEGEGDPRLAGRAIDVGMRLAGALALQEVWPEQPLDLDGIQHRLLKALDSSLWSDSVSGILSLATSDRGRRGREWAHPNEIDTGTGKPFLSATQRANRKLVDLATKDLSWLEALKLIHEWRRSTPKDRVELETLTHVEKHLKDVIQAAQWQSAVDVCKAVFPRGGLDPNSSAAHFVNAEVWSFYRDMTSAIARRRADAVDLLLRRWT